MHIRHRCRTSVVGVGQPILHQPHRRGLQVAQCLFEPSRKIRQLGHRLCRRDLCSHDTEEQLNSAAPVLRELAADEVERLHSIGAFIDHRDPRITDVLFHAPFGNVTVSAVNLLAGRRDLIPLVGAIALDDGGQQRNKIVGVLAFLLGLRLVREIDLQRAPQAQCAQTLGHGFCFHQHPAHIGVDKQRVGLFAGLLGTRQRAALSPILGIVNRILHRDFGNAQTLQADAEARGVHHDEHRSEALHLLPDEIAGRTIIVHHAGRIRVNAHLVLDRPAGDAVARTKAAVVVDEKLRDDEQADTLYAVGRAGGFRQHKMDDVLGQVVLAR